MLLVMAIVTTLMTGPMLAGFARRQPASAAASAPTSNA
jgi:hypothetical protein